MPGADRDDESGQYTEKYPTGRFLQAIDNVGGMAGTQDVADYVGCSYETAYKKLRTLEDSGSVNSQKVANARVWLRGDEQTPSEQRETGESASADTVKGSTTPTDGERTNDSADTRADVVDRVADAENWADDHRLDDRKAAARAVLDYAREHGTVSQQEAKEQVYPEHSVEGQDPRTWYRKTIRPVLNEAAEYDNSARAYRLAGPDQDG